MGALSCGSFGTPHLHWAIHRDSLIGGSGTGGSYGGNAVVPEPLDGVENLKQGLLITSTNTGQAPKCGDGVCNGTETPASCPSDCKACAPVPPEGRTVDDSETQCFSRSGTPSYWHSEAAGHLGSLWWTTATSDAAPDNWAEWKLDFAEAGDYQLEAFVTTAFAQSQKAKYTIFHGGAKDSHVLDQSAADGWRDLGTYAFAQGGSQSVRLDDNTGEAVSLKRKLVFDAIRLTRIGAGGTAGAGGVAGSAGTSPAGGAPSGGSGGSGGGSGSGGTIGSTGGTGANPAQGGAGANPAHGGTDDAADGGCSCRTERGGGSAWGALAFALGLLLLRRWRD
jgi:MYXO-CTERM domain-containing protein